MCRTMDLTLILRDAPEHNDAAYKLLYSLCPRKILYSTDFGGRALAKSRDLARHTDRLKAKLDATREIVPFNGASEISPVLPSYLFSGELDEQTRGDAIGEAFRLFPDVKTVYFDLGVHINVEAAKEMAEAMTKFRPDVRIGIIAPISEHEAVGEAFKGKTNVFPCPFLNPSVSLAENLSNALLFYGPSAEVFCAYVPKEDAENFAVTIAASPLPLFVFWSPTSAKEIAFAEKSSCEEAPVPVETYKNMKALYSSIVRAHRSIDAEMIGAVNASDVVRVREYPPDADGTTFGKVILGEETIGYVVVRHFNQPKFAKVETTS